MISGTTREFMALHALAMHTGRPHTPTDQAHIESFFGHLKGEWPHLEQIDNPSVLAAELEQIQVEYNSVVSMPGSATSPPTMNTKDKENTSASNAKKGCAPHAPHVSPTVREHPNSRT